MLSESISTLTVPLLFVKALPNAKVDCLPDNAEVNPVILLWEILPAKCEFKTASSAIKALVIVSSAISADTIASSAINCGQFYVNHRWLGGMLTNWATVSKSIKRLKELESKIESGEINNLTKKERLNTERTK